MGFFGSRKRISVNSSVYNLAGDIDKRPDFLKTILFDQIMFKSYSSMSEAIVSNYLKGMGIKLRGLVPYATRKEYFQLTGQGTAKITATGSANKELVAESLEAVLGYPINVNDLSIGNIDLDWWGLKYLADNQPDKMDDVFDTQLGEEFLEINFYHTDKDEEPYETLVTDVPIVEVAVSGDYLYVLYSQRYVPPEEEPDEEEDPPEEEEEPEIPPAEFYPQQVYIYRKGSGQEAVDELFTTAAMTGQCFPIVPIKYDRAPGRDPKVFYIDEESTGHDALLYQANKKLLRRVGDNTTYTGILKSLKGTKNHEKINYAYVFFGVALNTKADSAKKYLYEFFKTFGGLGTGSDAYQAYLAAKDIAHQSLLTWRLWKEAQGNYQNPLNGQPEPVLIPAPTPPNNSFKFSLGGGSNLKLDYEISWDKVEVITGTGSPFGLRPGRVSLEVIPGPKYTESIGGGQYPMVVYAVNYKGQGSQTRIRKQLTADTWEELVVYGLHSVNTIYGNKSVLIKAETAMADNEESGLLVPLHTIPFKTLGLRDATQIGSSSMYLMLNYYSVTKKKWYATGVFQAIVVIVAVIISIYFPPFAAVGTASSSAGAASAGALAGAGMASGTVGTVASVTVASALASAAVNAIAGMVIARLVTKVASKYMGAEWAAAVGAIAGIYTTIAMGSPGSISLDSFNASNLIRLTSSVLDSMTLALQEKTTDFIQSAQAEAGRMQEYMTELNQMYQAEFDGGLLNPQRYMDAMFKEFQLNSPAVFFERTLLSGSDIASLSLGSISTSLDLTLPYT